MSDSNSSDDGSAFVTVTVSPDPGITLVFDGMRVTEELGRPFLIQLELSSGKTNSKLTSMLGSSVTVSMTDAKGVKTYFNGVLGRIAFVGLDGGVYRYHVELRPWIWLLSHIQDCKIFQNLTPGAIIKQIFSDNGFSDIQDNRQNASKDPTLEYCVQYRETSFDFVTRLMEQYGIYYYVTFADGKNTLVLADDPNSQTALSTAIPFKTSQTEQRAVEDHIWEWSSDQHLRSGSFTFRDYNFLTPSADLTAKSVKAAQPLYGSMEVYDYPGIYLDASSGSNLSDIRMQDISARIQLFEGRTNARAVHSGVTFTLSGAPDTSLNQSYLVVRSVTTITKAEGGSDNRGQLVDSYRVEVAAIPAATPFRLEPITPKPMIRGPQTALVVGDSGEEITVDQYGRIKVQFYWDRVGTKDQNSSCWIRVAQSWAGASWGAMVIPRMGMEVVVAFLEGNPDRPLVTGVVYNATQTAPYALPDKKNISTFKTNSTKGGGGFNELRFDDTKGSEEVFLQAQKDFNWQVLNNETGTITQDQSITVSKGNRSITVSQGNETTTISTGNRSATVSQGNESLTVGQGNRSVTVSQGNDSHTISLGNHTLTVSAGTSTTKVAQAYEVDSDLSITISGTSGVTVKCGASSIALTPSSISMSAPQITINADAMLTLKGGTVAIN